jgi:hypothetical protein
VTTRAAGTNTQRARFLKVAKRILRKHKRSKVLVVLAIEREDGSLWSEPAYNQRVTIVR